MGVIGAGRVGAVLAAALRAAGHEIVSAAGESDASRRRADALLPGVPLDKPTAVARACDLLLLTVPDDMLDNVVTMLSASGAIRPGQVVVHTSGRQAGGSRAAVLVGARPIAMHPAMAAAVKLPHHGSIGNVNKELLAAVETPRWLISTNGANFSHPHTATAELVAGCHSGAEYFCNYRVPSTDAFADSKRPARWRVHYAGDNRVESGPAGGIAIDLDRPRGGSGRISSSASRAMPRRRQKRRIAG